MVGADVRQVEAEIDRCIREMPVWHVRRDVLLRRLMTIWRDGLELMHLMAAHAAMFQVEEGLKASLANERLMATGAYQALKWAMEFAHDDGRDEVSDEELVDLVMNTAGVYQVFVDALKLGAHDRTEFSVDRDGKTLKIYEGGNVSGHDAAIVQRDHITVPFHHQSPLVDDSDQLTTRWTAGDYRKYYQWLDILAREAETETIVARFPLTPEQEIMKRPVVVELPSPPPALTQVQEDLTLTVAKAQGPLKWKIDSWHDCPLVQIGDRVYGVSVALRTLAGLDDYMLRAAVLHDPGQYEKVSGLREERMIAICKTAFEMAGWTFTPHYHLTNPPRELDGYATREAETCIVQLKSTLRPQSPWEVYKRNIDVIDGITHTAEVVRRLGKGTTGIVITDGYEGDYVTWKESLANGVPVAALQDVEWIAKNPRGAFKTLAERAGIQEAVPPEELPERNFTLRGWKFRLLDQSKPIES
jgi:hypothetical protein